MSSPFGYRSREKSEGAELLLVPRSFRQFKWDSVWWVFHWSLRSRISYCSPSQRLLLLIIISLFKRVRHTNETELCAGLCPFNPAPYVGVGLFVTGRWFVYSGFAVRTKWAPPRVGVVFTRLHLTISALAAQMCGTSTNTLAQFSFLLLQSSILIVRPTLGYMYSFI